MARTDDEERPRKRPRPVDDDYEDEDEEEAPRAARRRPDDEEEEDRPRRRRRRPRDDDDDDDYSDGDTVSTIIPYTNPMALIGYYCGIFSIIPAIGLLLGPAAVVLGALGVRTVSKYPSAKGTGHAITAVILGLLTSVVNWAFLFVVMSMGWVKFTERYLGMK